MSLLKFSVIGIEPAPQGSKSYVGKNLFGKAVLIEASKRVQPWRKAVRGKARKCIKTPIQGACKVKLVFKLKRRKDHLSTNGQVRASAPKHYVVKRNDIDKLVRSTLDGLTGIAFKDDCQVINLIAERRYANFGEQVGADIEIQPVE